MNTGIEILFTVSGKAKNRTGIHPEGVRLTGKYLRALGGGVRSTGKYLRALGGGVRSTGKYFRALGGGGRSTGKYLRVLGGGVRSTGRFSVPRKSRRDVIASIYYNRQTGANDGCRDGACPVSTDCVIASEAKQSIYRYSAVWNASVTRVPDILQKANNLNNINNIK
jgi:hypothetical protein